MASDRQEVKGKEAAKLDDGKMRLDLVPPEAMYAMGWVLLYGAEKYGAGNWENNGGMRWGRLFAAAMRHLWAWWAGEEKDAESGYPHLWHALCCIAFLVAYESRDVYRGQDDRPFQA